MKASEIQGFRKQKNQTPFFENETAKGFAEMAKEKFLSPFRFYASQTTCFQSLQKPDMSKNETTFAQIETFFAKIYRNIFADKKIIRIFALFKTGVAMDTFCFSIHYIGTNRFIS